MRLVSALALVVLSLPFATPAAAAIRGNDRPGESCARREPDGTLVTGACNVVCKGRNLYEASTDAEVDAISSNGGACNGVRRVSRTTFYSPGGSLSSGGGD